MSQVLKFACTWRAVVTRCIIRLVAQPNEQFTACTLHFHPKVLNIRYTTELRLSTNVSLLQVPERWCLVCISRHWALLVEFWTSISSFCRCTPRSKKKLGCNFHLSVLVLAFWLHSTCQVCRCVCRLLCDFWSDAFKRRWYTSNYVHEKWYPSVPNFCRFCAVDTFGGAQWWPWLYVSTW